MKPASPFSLEARAQLDELLRKVIDKINQDPSKAAIVLTEWATSCAKNSTKSSHPTRTLKKAA